MLAAILLVMVLTGGYIAKRSVETVHAAVLDRTHQIEALLAE
jgi:hypothetical protein